MLVAFAHIVRLLVRLFALAHVYPEALSALGRGLLALWAGPTGDAGAGAADVTSAPSSRNGDREEPAATWKVPS